jgi:GDPmannose 4,6-dehydratase
VVATGTAYTVKDFLGFAFDHVGLDWEKYVRFDERYMRPSEVDSLIGDASRAETQLGWKPRVLTPELARLMVDADMAALTGARIDLRTADRHPSAPSVVADR